MKAQDNSSARPSLSNNIARLTLRNPAEISPIGPSVPAWGEEEASPNFPHNEENVENSEYISVSEEESDSDNSFPLNVILIPENWHTMHTAPHPPITLLDTAQNNSEEALSYSDSSQSSSRSILNFSPFLAQDEHNS